MTKTEFNARVNDMCKFINESEHDSMREELIKRNIRDPFTYGMWCEHNFELNLREDYKRKTTYTSDFSIAEWCVPIEGMKAISQTLKDALINWRDSIEWFAEIMMVVNAKSWEHAARGNNKYGAMYSQLYYDVRDLYFDWFEGTDKADEASRYYMDYID